jgi:hypothetical protein
MIRKMFVLLLVVCVLLLAPLPVSHAQSDRSTLIAFVAAAYEATTVNQSFTKQDTTELSMTLATQGISIEMLLDSTSESVAQLGATLEDHIMQSKVTQHIKMSLATGQVSEGDMVSEMILLNGVLYMRALEQNGILAGTQSEKWQTLTKTESSEGMSDGALNYDALLSTMIGARLALTDESVLSIVEVAADPIDGQTMRAFEIEFNAAALGDLITQMAGAFNLGNMGVDVEQLLQDMFENAKIQTKLWVGVEDNLIHRTENAIEIDTELELMGYTFDLKMVQRSTENYSDFGRTVEVSVPRD